jgi:hypothetical protein
MIMETGLYLNWETNRDCHNVVFFDILSKNWVTSGRKISEGIF